MSAHRAEVAVVGLGAVGSATVLELARRRVPVIGIDQFHPPHLHGSTHGRSRVIREAYYESPVYVPLVQRAYQRWRELEVASRRPLLRPTGGLMIGPVEGPLIRGTRASAEQHGLPFEPLNAREIRRRFPVFNAGPGMAGVLEPRAGYLDPEACVEASLGLAADLGATLRYDEGVTGWEPSAGSMRLRTAAGTVDCGTLVLAAGPWMPELPRLAVPLTVERQVMYWFQPIRNPERFTADRMPVFIWEWEPGRLFYGVPDHGAGFKVARHHGGEATTARTVSRAVQPGEVTAMRSVLRRTIPDADGPLCDATTCLYTNTPDHHFVLGRHPEEPRVILATACSGHGFKFASVLGEILADLAMDRVPAFDLSPFAPGRFGAPGGR